MVSFVRLRGAPKLIELSRLLQHHTTSVELDLRRKRAVDIARGSPQAGFRTTAAGSAGGELPACQPERGASTHIQRITPNMREGPAIVEPTEEMLRDIRSGDRTAEKRLYDRYLPLLRRWAHGRLPHSARDISDTDDLVQVTLLRALRHLDEFESSGSGSFLAYLRQILLNEVRAELRKHHRHGSRIDVDEIALADEGDSVVENLVGHERLRAYEEVLATLERRQQELIVMRLEFGMSYQEIGVESGASADAVRMTVTRALKTMALAISARNP